MLCNIIITPLLKDQGQIVGESRNQDNVKKSRIAPNIPGQLESMHRNNRNLMWCPPNKINLAENGKKHRVTVKSTRCDNG